MRYPILAYQPRVRDLDTALDPTWLLDLRPRELMLPWFDGLRVVDAEGVERVVRRAEVARERRRWLGLSRRIDVALVMERAERRVPLADLVRAATEAVQADASFGARPEARAAVLADLRAAPTHEALIRILHRAAYPAE